MALKKSVTGRIVCHTTSGMFRDEAVAIINNHNYIIRRSEIVDNIGEKSRVRVKVHFIAGASAKEKRLIELPTDYGDLVDSEGLVVEEIEK